MSLDKIRTIAADIKAKKIKPIYFLQGEEPYFIDTLSKYIEDNVLTEAEKGFNQMTFYGRDVTIDDIVSNAKRYPMGADRQVIIVREAQDLSRSIENLLPYVQNPQPSTVLVMCYKYKTLDGRTKLGKTIASIGVLFESKKMYDNQIPDWIKRVLAAKGFTIDQKASMMLVEFIGSDLSRINNELQKLQLILKPGQHISDAIIEENIGISKDFNNFELQSAIGALNYKKAFAIIQYFGQNPKNNPIVVTTGILNSFFSKIMIYHGSANNSEAQKLMGVHPYFWKEYELAARNFNMKRASAAIHHIRKIDNKSKGIGSNATPSDLFKELLIGLFS